MRGLLFDMDGVLYNAEEPIPGAPEAIRWVREQGIPHLFVTNTTSHSRSHLAEKLARFGIPGAADDILTPCDVAAEWLRQRPAEPVALFVKPAAQAPFAGLERIPDDAETGARHVVIGDLAHAWDFAAINRAFRLLHAEPEATLIALGMTRYWKDHDGISLDVAPFVALLEHATGRKPLVFGKPAAAFFEGAAAKLGVAKDKLGVAKDEIVMIGDDIETDVGGAQRAGLKGVLVRTGKFRPSDLAGAVRPHAVLNSIASLRRWWETGIGERR
jgi:phospholysine phosphohistidine inorganic pyrophosphate phosphatase